MGLALAAVGAMAAVTITAALFASGGADGPAVGPEIGAEVQTTNAGNAGTGHGNTDAPPPAVDGEGADRPVSSPASLQAESDQSAAIAATVSQQVFPNGEATELVLIRSEASGDALAAGSLIGLFDTTFLTTDSQRLSATTANEIDRLGTPRVHILGGPAAISLEIEEQLQAAGHNVHRHSGPTQADTAVDIARAHFPDAQIAVLVRTPDRTQGPVQAISSALAATTMAAAQDLPMLLTEGDVLSSSTEQFLDDATIKRVIVIGDEEEISPDVTVRLRELGIDWTRWGGEDRFATAVEIARNRGFDTLEGADAVVLVEGEHDSVWPAGFLGSVLASRENGPVLLTQGNTLPQPTAAYLGAGLGEVELICTAGVTEAACSTAETLLASGAAAPQPVEPNASDRSLAEAQSRPSAMLNDEEEGPLWGLGVYVLLGLLGLAAAVPAARLLRRRPGRMQSARAVAAPGGSPEDQASARVGERVPPAGVGVDEPSGDMGKGRRGLEGPTADETMRGGKGSRARGDLLQQQRTLHFAQRATLEQMSNLRLQVRLAAAFLALLPLATIAFRQAADRTYLSSLVGSVPGLIALLVASCLVGFGTVWLLNLELTSPPAWPWRRRDYAAVRRTEAELIEVLQAGAECATAGMTLTKAVTQAATRRPSATADSLRMALIGSPTDAETESTAAAAASPPIAVYARALLDADARGEDPAQAMTAAAATLATFRYRWASRQQTNMARNCLIRAIACVLPAIISLLMVGW